jgi:hypothetical protein
MAFREIKDIKKTADYQRNLRAALVAAQEQKAEFVVWQAFPFAEQTAQMIVVAPTVDNSLIRKVGEQNAHKLGFGECRVAGKKLLVKPGNSISESQISLAFKIAKISIEVELVGRDVDLAAPAATQPALRQQTQANGAPVADAAQVLALKAVADAPKLIERLDDARSRTRDMKEATALTQLQRKFASEWEDKDYVAVKAMKELVEKTLTAVEARLKERDKQQASYELVVKKLEGRYDAARDLVPAPLFKKAMTAWSAAAQHAAKDEYTDASKLLAAMPGLLDTAEEATRDAWRERLKLERDDANSQLSSPTEGETALLDEKAKAALAHAQSLDAAKFEDAFKAFEAAVKALVDMRRLRQLAQTMYNQAESMWFDQRANLRAPAEAKAKGAYGNVVKWMEEAKKLTELSKVAQALKNVVKQAQEVERLITEELKARGDLNKKMSDASAQFAAALNLSKTEDAAATLYGNGRFSGGMLNAIWKQVLNVHGDNPPNGAIPGLRQLSDVESAITTWRSTGDSGVLTNFHVPGGGRPQAKWEKNFMRAEVKANFCVKWRGNKVNIHVDVDPRSYFDRYADKVDWTLVPQSIRQQLGQA